MLSISSYDPKNLNWECHPSIGALKVLISSSKYSILINNEIINGFLFSGDNINITDIVHLIFLFLC